MKQEDIKDAAQIVNNILEQPLSIEGASENISLLKAAEQFNKSNPESDLYKIIRSFIEHPEGTKALLTELELLLADLKT